MAVLPADVIGRSILSHVRVSFIAQGAAGVEPRGAWDVLRHDVIPVGAAYLVLLWILVAYRRATQESEGANPPARDRRLRGWKTTRDGTDGTAPAWSDFLRYVVAMVAAGYVFFLVIVVVFYFVLGGEDWGFIRQALVEGSLLAFALVLPAFVLLSWLEDHLRRRLGERSTKH